VKPEVLKRYFENTSSEAETAAVEQWLLEPGSQEAFNRFLDEYWAEHLHSSSGVFKRKILHRGAVRRLAPKLAIAACFLVVASVAVYFFAAEKYDRPAEPIVAEQMSRLDSIPVASAVENPQERSEAAVTAVVAESRKEKPIRKKLSSGSSVARSNVADTGKLNQQGVKMSRFSKVMINEVALSQLDRTEQFEVLSHMALRVNIHEASLAEIAGLFREKFGIQIELCALSQAKRFQQAKSYSASFAEVTFSDLINDMSKQMMFTYSFVDHNTVKICFD